MKNTWLIKNSNLFDFWHYVRSAKKIFLSRDAAIKHYLNKGWKSGCSPGKRFDSQWFIEEYPEVSVSGLCPLLFYIKNGKERLMYPNRSEKNNILLIINSPLFDHVCYSEKVGVEFSSRASAAVHYLKKSSSESPSQFFDAEYYLNKNHDVARKKTNPLLHYEKHGAQEGRYPHAEIENAELKEVDTLFRKGSIEEASRRINQLIEHLENNTPAQDAAKLLKAEMALFCGELHQVEASCKELLSKSWKVRRPKEYDRACGLLVDALCQQKKYRAAQEIVLTAYQHLRVWHAAALTRLRSTLSTPADLALFEGVVTPAIDKNNAFSSHALLQYSFAARDTGDMPLALDLIKRRYTQGVTLLHEFGSEPPAPDASWQAEARLALEQMRECLEAASIPFFLISGTLLGCIRDNDIIEHDKDIDIGVMDDVSIDKIKSAFIGKCCFVVLPDIHDKLIRVRHANGVMADIFIHWLKDDLLWHEGRKTGWWNTPFSLVDTEFIGKRYLIPNKPDKYLQENYGNWKIPDKNFDTFSDTPNMYTANHEELVWYLYKQLLESYVSGNLDSYRRVWRTLNTVEVPGPELQAIYHMSI